MLHTSNVIRISIFIMYIDDILVIYYVVYIANDIVRFEKQIILLENILFALIKLHNKTVFCYIKEIRSCFLSTAGFPNFYTICDSV